MVCSVVLELSGEAENALTSSWQAVVGDEFDIVVSVDTLIFLCSVSWPDGVRVA